jgi:hypothetical protein
MTRDGRGQWSVAAVALVLAAMMKAEIAAARARTVVMTAANVMTMAVVAVMAVGIAAVTTMAALREMVLAMKQGQ